ncbi:unnamed protein product [Linum tenue]|uniref:Uncharacterized protein n=1 Tax=Linum tenue TaxID=586396 RepID=A0AAV0NTC5_9ROSI|nr:unnamed protein product [Linum tenue]
MSSSSLHTPPHTYTHIINFPRLWISHTTSEASMHMKNVLKTFLQKGVDHWPKSRVVVQAQNS